jgi:3-oxosteroid 1-dehydrogenase
MEVMKWDVEADVAVAGTGAAGSAAAATAFSKGASVVMIEKARGIGGTSIKSGGQPWIPNNFALRAQGVEDKRDDCLRFMARGNYPQLYNPEDARFGLAKQDYDLLAAYYDNGYQAIDYFMQTGACKFVQSEPVLPDYVDHVPENKVLRGRLVAPTAVKGTTGYGADLIRQFSAWIKGHGIQVLSNHRVQRILLNDKREAIGIQLYYPTEVSVTFGLRRRLFLGAEALLTTRILSSIFRKAPLTAAVQSRPTQAIWSTWGRLSELNFPT